MTDPTPDPSPTADDMAKRREEAHERSLNTQAEREAMRGWEDPCDPPEEGEVGYEAMMDMKHMIEACDHEAYRRMAQPFDGESVDVDVCDGCGLTKLPCEEWVEVAP